MKKLSQAITTGDEVIGEINPPGWLGKHGNIEVGEGFGLVGFFSNMLRLAAVAAGLFAIVNLILAGYEFISAGGNSDKVTNAQNKIWNSLIGLLIIAASYTIAALVGLIMFGDVLFIISPKISGVGK